MSQADQDHAQELINEEHAKQMRMWGVDNERADATNGQLIQAAVANLSIVEAKRENRFNERMLKNIKDDFYPADWDGFRDYGSDIANLVVAAAYLKAEIARKLHAGESTYRAPRTEPYVNAKPNVEG